MERVLTREDVELPCQKQEGAYRASFSRINSHESVFQLRYILLDGLRSVGSLVHLPLEHLDMGGVPLKSMSNFFLEVINNNKIGEERQYVLDLE